jgi:hypothetical protein
MRGLILAALLVCTSAIACPPPADSPPIEQSNELPTFPPDGTVL